MKTALCIIDMQPKFDAASEIIPGVLRQIDLAINRKSPILIVEYGYDNPSYQHIYDAANHSMPHLVKKIIKTEDDGSDEIIHAMEDANFPFNCMRLCGVNTCACVKRTAKGLKRSGLFNRIEVAISAVKCTCIKSFINCYNGALEEIKYTRRE